MIMLYLNASLWGTGVALVGAVFDRSCAAEGYVGIILLILNWKGIGKA